MTHSQSAGGVEEVRADVKETRRERSSGPRVAVIGAGLGGIATAVNLKKAGIEDFVVFEQSEGPGGTWWDNTYPGCEVDIHSHYYSFSFFQKYDWPRTHSRRVDLQRYCEATVDRFALRSHFRFGTRVEEVVWDDEAGLYRIILTSGEETDASIVVSCLGLLNFPKYPEWPGLESFQDRGSTPHAGNPSTTSLACG